MFKAKIGVARQVSGVIRSSYDNPLILKENTRVYKRDAAGISVKHSIALLEVSLGKTDAHGHSSKCGQDKELVMHYGCSRIKSDVNQSLSYIEMQIDFMNPLPYAVNQE